MTTEATLNNIEFNEDGYMVDPQAWSPEIAGLIAESLSIPLTDRHWIVINFARAEFAANDEAPTIRRITKQTDVNTKELYALFPKGAAKTVAKISGLGKPTGCI